MHRLLGFLFGVLSVLFYLAGFFSLVKMVLNPWVGVNHVAVAAITCLFVIATCFFVVGRHIVQDEIDKVSRKKTEELLEEIRDAVKESKSTNSENRSTR